MFYIWPWRGLVIKSISPRIRPDFCVRRGQGCASLCQVADNLGSSFASGFRRDYRIAVAVSSSNPRRDARTPSVGIQKSHFNLAKLARVKALLFFVEGSLVSIYLESSLREL